MSFRPFNWNVVVLGAWNRAIFTPQWIAEFLFEVPKNRPVEVEVPLSVPTPPKVKHEGIAVSVGAGVLEVSAEPCDFGTLERACICACRALTELPRTPVTAAGFNLRYRSDEAPRELLDAVACGIDDAISDAELQIVRRDVTRRLVWGTGVINAEIEVDESGSTSISLNFHKNSGEHSELKSWLETPMGDVQAHAEVLLTALPGVEI